MEGWIKLHRKMLENPVVMIDAEHFALWVYLLLNATHKPIPMMFGGKKIMLQPGQFITGTTKLSSETHISRSKVHRILKTFKNDMQIETQTCAQGTLISIVNWEKYQIDETQNETLVKRKRNASETLVDTNKNIKNIKNGNKFCAHEQQDYDFDNIERMVRSE